LIHKGTSTPSTRLGRSGTSVSAGIWTSFGPPKAAYKRPIIRLTFAHALFNH